MKSLLDVKNLPNLNKNLYYVNINFRYYITSYKLKENETIEKFLEEINKDIDKLKFTENPSIDEIIESCSDFFNKYNLNKEKIKENSLKFKEENDEKERKYKILDNRTSKNYSFAVNSTFKLMLDLYIIKETFFKKTHSIIKNKKITEEEVDQIEKDLIKEKHSLLEESLKLSNELENFISLEDKIDLFEDLYKKIKVKREDFRDICIHIMNNVIAEYSVNQLI
jgi:hypothetical protein